MILKFSRKILLACLICALLPLGLAAVLTLWRESALRFSPAQISGLFLFLGLTVGFAFITSFIAAFLLNHELRQTLGSLRTALDQFSRGSAPPVLELPLPQDELGQLLDEVTGRLSELAALRETTLDLTAQLDMPRLLQTIVERASTLMGVTGGFVYEADLPRRKLRRLAAVGLRTEPPGWEMDFGEGVVGKVAEAGESLMVHGYHDWPGRSPRFADYPLFNLLGVPMRWQGQLIGVLSLEDEIGGRRFTERDKVLAEQFANQAAAAIGNARSYAAANRQAERLGILHQASQAISHSLDLEQVYQATYYAVGQLMPNEAFGIALLNETGQRIEAVYLVDRGVRYSGPTVPSDAGLTGLVIRAGHPILFHSADDWPPEMVHYGSEESVQSILAAPLQVGERAFGALITQSYRRSAFSEEDAPLLATLANQAASAIQNARLFQFTQRQLSQLSILHEVARAAVSAADLDQVISRSIEALREQVDYDLLSVLLLDRAGTRLRPYSSSSTLAPEALEAEIPLGAGIVGWVAQTGQPIWVKDVDREPRYQRVIPGMGSELCVPLKLGERIIGVLNAEVAAHKAFTSADERLLTITAGLLAPIIENARLYEHDRERLTELSLLHEIALSAISAPDIDEGITQALRVLQRRLGSKIIGVGLMDETGLWMEAHPSYLGVEQPHLIAPIRVGEGVVGRVIQTGQPVRIDDVAGDPDFSPSVPNVRSELVVPLKVADRVIGVINTESHEVAAYSDTDQQLLTVVAGLLAPIIENARLRARAEQQAHELDLLVKAQVAASASLDLNTVLTTVVEQLGRALQVTSAYVVEVNETQAMTVAEYYSPEASDLERVSDLNMPYPVAMWVKASLALREGRPAHTSPDDPEASEAEREHLRQFGGRSALIVPLMRQGHALGYVELWETRQDRVFSEREIQLAQTLAGSVTAALENAKLYQAAQRRAEQMQLVNRVGRDIAGILDVAALLVRVSQRLETAFGYYHAKAGLIEGNEVVFRPRFDERRGTDVPEIRLRVDGPGIIAWTAQHAEPRLTPDVSADPYFQANPFLPATRSEAAVPLLAEGRAIGVLDVQSDRLGGLGPEDVTTLQAVSGQLAVAVENARLYAEARQRADEVSALLATTIALGSSMELSARLDAIAKFARRLVEADGCTLYKLDAEGEYLQPILVHDKYAAQVGAMTIPLGDGITGYVALTGKGELVNRADLDRRAKQIPGTPLTPESLIVVPLRVSQRLTGVMRIYREGFREFKPHDLNLISSFAAQAAVAIENAELYQTSVERANSLQAAYDELAEMDRLKDEMVQNISHELRTPMTFLKSYVDLLLSRQLGPLQPEQEKSLQVMADKTQTLVRLVNDVFTLQVVSPATIKMAPLDLAALARAAADGVAAAARQAEVGLVVNLPEAPVIVLGDPLRLTQVFDNLLGNAMKFTGSGDEIQLSVQPEPDHVRVEVRDTGIGISTDKLERIFDRFYQVDGTPTRRRGGIGLGLAISKLIVESHGGSMGVESQPGQGSCFYFVLPLSNSTNTLPSAEA